MVLIPGSFSHLVGGLPHGEEPWLIYLHPSFRRGATEGRNRERRARVSQWRDSGMNSARGAQRGIRPRPHSSACEFPSFLRFVRLQTRTHHPEPRSGGAGCTRPKPASAARRRRLRVSGGLPVPWRFPSGPGISPAVRGARRFGVRGGARVRLRVRACDVLLPGALPADVLGRKFQPGDVISGSPRRRRPPFGSLHSSRV